MGIKFQLYNSLFTSLPFHKIEKTGILLSMLLMQCDEGYKKQSSPEEILENFFKTQTTLVSESDILDILFRFVQYMERQVVLFDALEDAAFTQVNDVNGKGTIKALALEIEQQKKEKEFVEKLKDFSIQLVLTAHPTQFYRGAVLGIINDLTKAVSVNNENNIYSYLQQLGRTAFFQQQKPTPFDEATILIWYLRNIFYPAAGKIVTAMKNSFGDAVSASNQIIKMGFWPGGDRDGNPFVKAATTLQVANSLKDAILKSYHFDIIKLRRRLTFKGVDMALLTLDKRLHNTLYNNNGDAINVDILLSSLQDIRNQLVHDHNSLFVELVEELINKIEIFGMHFASLDVRQESSVHGQLLHTVAENSKVLPDNYADLDAPEKIDIITKIGVQIDSNIFTDELHKDALEVVKVIKTIQQNNGELGCNRYIISQCHNALNAMEVMGIFLLGGWKAEDLTVDIVPLFETVDDLQLAAETMRTLYENSFYKQHLQRRKNKQTIMLGFS
ncbi:MAG: phosphoenolpyruvate carboxylase, partial [Ferruginibacter sp.]|nr:phosphoenolpyruvate carboxylase [Ferruginibacter sp.]